MFFTLVCVSFRYHFHVCSHAEHVKLVLSVAHIPTSVNLKGVTHVMIVACYHPLPLLACMLHLDLVSMYFNPCILQHFSESVFTLVYLMYQINRHGCDKRQAAEGGRGGDRPPNKIGSMTTECVLLLHCTRCVSKCAILKYSLSARCALL